MTGPWQIVECRIDGDIWWLALLRAGAAHAVVQQFDGSELKLRLAHRADLGSFQNAAAIEDVR